MATRTGSMPDLARFRALSEAGARNAAEARSQLIGRPLTLEVPWARAVALESVPEIVGGRSRHVCALSLRVFGGLRGNLLLLFGAEQVPLLLRLMLGGASGAPARPNEGDEVALTDLQRSALQEVGKRGWVPQIPTSGLPQPLELCPVPARKPVTVHPWSWFRKSVHPRQQQPRARGHPPPVQLLGRVL